MPWNAKARAVACVRGNRDNPKLCGTVEFLPREDGVLVVAQICGLPESETGFHGFHIHTGGDCGNDFADAGGHFNPGEKPHPEHAGDMPPLLNCGGKACLAFKTDRFHIRDVLGRTVIIHGQADDFRSQPSGDAGAMIACGVIRKA